MKTSETIKRVCSIPSDFHSLVKLRSLLDVPHIRNRQRQRAHLMRRLIDRFDSRMRSGACDHPRGTAVRRANAQNIVNGTQHTDAAQSAANE